MAEVNDSVEFDDFVLTVVELDGTRIVKIKVTKKPEPQEEKEQTEEQKQES